MEAVLPEGYCGGQVFNCDATGWWPFEAKKSTNFWRMSLVFMRLPGKAGMRVSAAKQTSMISADYMKTPEA